MLKFIDKWLAMLGRIPGLLVFENLRVRLVRTQAEVDQKTGDYLAVKQNVENVKHEALGKKTQDTPTPSVPPMTGAPVPSSLPSSNPTVPPASAPSLSPGPIQGRAGRGTLNIETSAPEYAVSQPPLVSFGSTSPAPQPQPFVGPTVESSTVPPSAAGRGTMMLDAPQAAMMVESHVDVSALVYSPLDPIDDQPAIVSPHVRSDQLMRLQYVCQLLRLARQPVCPLNGVLTVIPFRSMEVGKQETEELHQTIKSDLTTIQRELQLRCPATALVVGMEEQSGFRELVRRVGPDRAAIQRFGHRFYSRSEATVEQLAAFCFNVCGVFEDWIYTLFRQEGALSRPGNTHLYQLLCQIRSNIKISLARVLAGGFGKAATDKVAGEFMPFGGCYFTATGMSSDRQAFVRGVFEKLVEEQEQIEWTPQAISEDRRTTWCVYLGVTLAVSFLVTFVYLTWR